MRGGALSPESENHYPLSLKCLDENAVWKQCIDFPRAHTHAHTRAVCSSLPPPRARNKGRGGVGGCFSPFIPFSRVCSLPRGCPAAGGEAMPVPAASRACAPPLPGGSAAAPLPAPLSTSGAGFARTSHAFHCRVFYLFNFFKEIISK